MRNITPKFKKILRSLSVALSGLLFLAMASSVTYSYERVSGRISSDTTWGPNKTYYVTNNITVFLTVLTVEEGTLVKFAPGVMMRVTGTLDVNGTSGNNVVFTSRDDDAYGEVIDDETQDPPGNSDNDPNPGDWDKINVVGGTGYFDWCRIRYGGDTNLRFSFSGSDSYFNNSISEYSTNYGIHIRACSPTFQDSHIENNGSDGVHIDISGTPTFQGTYIGNNGDYGVYVRGVATPIFRDSTIADNDSYGVYITVNANPDFGTGTDPGNNTFQDNSEYHLYNDTSNVICAHGNTWDPPGGIYGPTMVVLSSFTAMVDDGKVILIWLTECEVDNVGFGIYRSDTRDGDYALIAFIPGAQDSERSNDYRFTDKQVKPGYTYYYYLEDVDLSGKRTKSDVLQIALPAPPSVPQPFLPVSAVPTETKPEILPERSSLLANYPNPSNPETWIPYTLAEPADVNIRIYDIRGHLARTLYLGYQPAGFYMSKDKAVYWDGRDDTGDQVASGVYFYSLSAGGFSAMRKMMILK